MLIVINVVIGIIMTTLLKSQGPFEKVLVFVHNVLMMFCQNLYLQLTIDAGDAKLRIL